jgi:hypothetical protein
MAVNNKLERIWQGQAVTFSMTYPRTSQEKLGKITKISEFIWCRGRDLNMGHPAKSQEILPVTTCCFCLDTDLRGNDWLRTRRSFTT